MMARTAKISLDASYCVLPGLVNFGSIFFAPDYKVSRPKLDPAIQFYDPRQTMDSL